MKNKIYGILLLVGMMLSVNGKYYEMLPLMKDSVGNWVGLLEKRDGLWNYIKYTNQSYFNFHSVEDAAKTIETISGIQGVSLQVNQVAELVKNTFLIKLPMNAGNQLGKALSTNPNYKWMPLTEILSDASVADSLKQEFKKNADRASKLLELPKTFFENPGQAPAQGGTQGTGQGAATSIEAQLTNLRQKLNSLRTKF